MHSVNTFVIYLVRRRCVIVPNGRTRWTLKEKKVGWKEMRLIKELYRTSQKAAMKVNDYTTDWVGLN